MGFYQRMNHSVCYFLILSLYITYHYCYTIEMNPYGNFMYPSLSTSSSSVSSSSSSAAAEAEAESPKLLVSLSKSLPTSQSSIDKYLTLNNEFNKDQFNPYSNYRSNYYYDYYYNRHHYHHHPRMSKRADLKDLSIHSDMAFIRKLFDQKNHELLRLG
ncbi:unnamed protein product [Schistosoma spindalis]|nr:unnamed protein product [Schistosoma spindale]